MHRNLSNFTLPTNSAGLIIYIKWQTRPSATISLYRLQHLASQIVICDAADEGRSLCISDQIDDQPTDEYITELLSGKCRIKLLGYYGEDHGAHYVSLAANTEDFLHEAVKRLFAIRPPTKATPTQPADVEVGQQQQVGYETDILS